MMQTIHFEPLEFPQSLLYDGRTGYLASRIKYLKKVARQSASLSAAVQTANDNEDNIDDEVSPCCEDAVEFLKSAVVN